MQFNLNLYKETVTDLTKLNNGENLYKFQPLCVQKMGLIQDLIRKNLIDIRK